jgi:two-component system cell cycle sensor histidine kinase/response regulator CckA
LNSDETIAVAAQINREENATDVASVATAGAVICAPFLDEGHAGGAETILLVEDEEFVRKVTGEVLESAGYRLVSARCAAEAAEALEAQFAAPEPIDLLLADLVLPGKSGHQLAYEFAGLCPHARILLMSGYAEQLALGGLSAHGREYLAKPFSSRTLLRRVRKALDKYPVDSRAPA